MLLDVKSVVTVLFTRPELEEWCNLKLGNKYGEKAELNEKWYMKNERHTKKIG